MPTTVGMNAQCKTHWWMSAKNLKQR